MEYHMFGENTFCAGATFVPKEGGFEEDDGWVITFVHNEGTSISEVSQFDIWQLHLAHMDFFFFACYELMIY